MASSSQENEGGPQNVPPALAEKPAGLPPGKYKLVGWEIVTTGRRLIDEICQIAAYIPPQTEYSQFIMPFGDLNPGARRRNKVRVVTVGRYRMLKHTLTHKVLKTKSEVTALVDFLNWLEAHKKEDEKIVLLYHEPRRLHPKVILQSMIRQLLPNYKNILRRVFKDRAFYDDDLKKAVTATLPSTPNRHFHFWDTHKLLERFESIVAGFTDSYALCNAKCLGSVRSVSLRLLATLLLEENSQSVVTAMDRATATYKIIEQLANQGEGQDIAAGGEAAESAPCSEMMDFAIEFGRPIYTERNDLDSLQNLLDRQNTFRSVMRPLLRCPRPQRRRLTHLRRILADAGLLFYQFKDAWHEGRRAGLERLMSPLEETVKAEDIKELLGIFECHFSSEQATRHLPPAPNAPAPMPEGAVYSPPEEFYFSSDSDSSGQMSSSFGVSSLTAAILMVKEDVDD